MVQCIPQTYFIRHFVGNVVKFVNPKLNYLVMLENEINTGADTSHTI